MIGIIALTVLGTPIIEDRYSIPNGSTTRVSISIEPKGRIVYTSDGCFHRRRAEGTFKVNNCVLTAHWTKSSQKNWHIPGALAVVQWSGETVFVEIEDMPEFVKTFRNGMRKSSIPESGFLKDIFVRSESFKPIGAPVVPPRWR